MALGALDAGSNIDDEAEISEDVFSMHTTLHLTKKKTCSMFF